MSLTKDIISIVPYTKASAEKGKAFQFERAPLKHKVGDTVIKAIWVYITDPQGKLRPRWTGSYYVKEILL